MKRVFGTLMGLTSVAIASAQFRINELAADLPGTDNGQEFFEIRADNLGAASMAGLTLLVIEGDGTGGGVIDQAFNLGSFSTGTNGLFLWRDSATVLSPAPEAATVVNVADFAPDIENGSNSYLLVSGFSGAVGNDLDAGNDGTLDSTPWTSVLDAVAVIEAGGGSEWAYADEVGGTSFVSLPFTPDALVRLNPWVGVDVSGTSPGPYAWDSLESVYADGTALDLNTLSGGAAAARLTPGSANPGLVPEPTTLGALAVGAIAFFRRRAQR